MWCYSPPLHSSVLWENHITQVEVYRLSQVAQQTFVLKNILKNLSYPNKLFLPRLSLLFTSCHFSDLNKQVRYFCLCSLKRVRTGEIGYWLANTGHIKNMGIQRGHSYSMSHLKCLTKKTISPCNTKIIVLPNLYTLWKARMLNWLHAGLQYQWSNFKPSLG